jgi:hypothetical protein
VEFKKETSKVKNNVTAHALKVATTSSINVILPEDGAKPFLLGMAELFNQGALFATHGSLLLGINGPEAIVLSRSILEHVTIEPHASMFDELFKIFNESDADQLMLVIIDLPVIERTLIGSLAVKYFGTKDNNFKPTKAMFKESVCDCDDCKTKKSSK